MELAQASTLFQQNKSGLERFSVKSLAIFGSVARGESRVDSDLDVLVDFSQPVGVFEFIRLKKYLEDLTGCTVDLVTPDALHPAMRKSILAEAVYVG